MGRGNAVGSSWPSASVVPWAEPHVGAIATQSYANPRYGPDGLALLREGLSAAEAIDRLTAADDDRAHRQIGVVDGLGRAASFTGEECQEWAGGRVGTGYAVQGNILVSVATVDALAETFEATEAAPLAERLLDCLAAAQEAGGDRRGQQSAALLVVQRDGGYAGLSDSLVDLRIDDHEQPIAELRRLYAAHQALFGVTPRSQWLTVDAELRTEIEQRLATLGFERLEDWAGVENLEERVDGIDAVDPVVLAELPEQDVSAYEVATPFGCPAERQLAAAAQAPRDRSVRNQRLDSRRSRCRDHRRPRRGSDWARRAVPRPRRPSHLHPWRGHARGRRGDDCVRGDPSVRRGAVADEAGTPDPHGRGEAGWEAYRPQPWR